MVDALSDCQEQIGTGYVAAIPFFRFDPCLLTLNYSCMQSPFYMIHKILQGMWDMHVFAGNQKALQVIFKLTNFFYKWINEVISKYSMDRWNEMLNVEFGGMNEFYYILYSHTNNKKHLQMAEWFDPDSFFYPLSNGIYKLSGLHGNTHLPIKQKKKTS